MRMPNRPIEWAFVRLIASAVVMVIALKLIGRDVVESMLPLVRWIIAGMDDHYRVLALGLASQADDTVIMLKVSLVKPLTIGGHTLYPHPLGVAQVTTLLGNALQPLVLAIIAISVWPCKAFTEWLLRAVIVVTMMFFLFMLDMPFVLLGELQAALVAAYSPGSFSGLVAWKGFMQGGGRLALGLACGALSVVAAQYIVVRFLRHGEYALRWLTPGRAQT